MSKQNSKVLLVSLCPFLFLFRGPGCQDQDQGYGYGHTEGLHLSLAPFQHWEPKGNVNIV